MIKHLTLFKFKFPGDLAEALSILPEFDTSAPISACITGFVAPSNETGLIATINGEDGQHLLLAHRTDARKVPGEELKRRIAAEAKRIENETGRKVGAKARRDLKEQITQHLLPQAFVKSKIRRVWFDLGAGTVGIEASSLSQADRVLTDLVKSVEGLAFHPINTTNSPESMMTLWVDNEENIDPRFILGSACDLHRPEPDNDKLATFKNVTIGGNEEISSLIEQGYTVTKLAMQYSNRDALATSFTLDHAGVIKGIKMDMPPADGESSFAADAWAFVSTMSALVFDLIYNLGDEVAEGGAA